MALCQRGSGNGGGVNNKYIHALFASLFSYIFENLSPLPIPRPTTGVTEENSQFSI